MCSTHLVLGLADGIALASAAPGLGQEQPDSQSTYSPSPAGTRSYLRRGLLWSGVAAAVFLGSCGSSDPVVSAGNLPRTELAPLSPGVLAVTGANVVPMTSVEVLEDHTIIARDGVITDLGPSADLEPPTDAVVIDGRDVWVMPGLMDMHAHVREADLPLYTAAGVTTIRNMWGTESIAALRAAVAGGAEYPTIYSASPGMDGDPPVWDGSVVVTSPERARAEVRRLEAEGWDFIKVYNRLSPGVYDAILAEAVELEIPVVGHVPLGADLTDGLDRRHATIEHLTGYAEIAADGRGPSGWLNFRPDVAATVARDVAAKGIRVCPTLTVLAHLAGTNLSDAEARRATGNQRSAVGILHDAGVPLLAGTDAGLDLVPAGVTLAREVELLAASGLSRFEALRTATVEPARFLGMEEHVGTIEVGKSADLVLLGANPLSDLGALASPVGVVLRGRRIH